MWHSKEMSPDFVRGQSVAETFFSHWGKGTGMGEQGKGTWLM